MTDVARQLAELPPEKRLQLVKLLKERAAGERATAQAAPVPESSLLHLDDPVDLDDVKSSWKQFYDSVSTQLDASMFGQFSYFLNYGYVANDDPQFAVVELPDQYMNRNSVKLVLEVIGDCPVTDRRVLDVGCGRGGTIWTFKTFFQPSTVTGLDLSATAIAFDRAAHGDDRTSFHEGDAENLPFPDGSFDIVTNVESSHSYPNVNRFYAQVHRVLDADGYFLYTDVFTATQLSAALAFLDHLGFELVRNTDITRNVLASSDEIAVSRVEAFDDRNDPALINNFLATPGSQIYEALRSGHWDYRILTLRKRR